MPPEPIIPLELASRPFTLAEARRAGLARWHLEGASWRRLAPGTYAWARLGDGPMLSIAAAYRRLPAGAAFAGLTSAWLQGLDVSPCDPIEAIAPEACGVSARAGICLRRASLESSEVEVCQGMPVTSLARTLSDLGQRLPLVEAVVIADMALHQGLANLGELREWAAARTGRKGITSFRRVLALAEQASESPMESRLRMLIVLAGLPRPAAQVQLKDRQGRFLARADLYYPDAGLILEYDGGTHRTSLVEDNRRQNALLSEGYRLLRFTAADVFGTPDAVVERVRSALLGGAGVKAAAHIRRRMRL